MSVVSPPAGSPSLCRCSLFSNISLWTELLKGAARCPRSQTLRRAGEGRHLIGSEGAPGGSSSDSDSCCDTLQTPPTQRDCQTQLLYVISALQSSKVRLWNRVFLQRSADPVFTETAGPPRGPELCKSKRPAAGVELDLFDLLRVILKQQKKVNKWWWWKQINLLVWLQAAATSVWMRAEGVILSSVQTVIITSL